MFPDIKSDVPMNELFFEKLPHYFNLFEGCGNMLGVVPLTLAGYEEGDGWKNDPRIRKILTRWGKEINSDSVMILTGDPTKLDEQGYHVKMFVFEPNGNDESGLGGAVSVMCGNGVRAVAAWVREFDPELKKVFLMTMSGLRTIAIEGELYIVEMGEFGNSAVDLSPYVKKERAPFNKEAKYLNVPIPQTILKDLSKYTSAKTWSIGLTGTRHPNGNIDGEPHVVIEIPRREIENIEGLRKLAVAAGPIITKNLEIFPLEVNANFVVVEGQDESGKFVIWNCTHERNLGDDSNHSVTAACGTGSTVAGGVMFEKYVKAPSQTVLVKCTGGDLEIANGNSKPMSLLLKGPANRVR